MYLFCNGMSPIFIVDAAASRGIKRVALKVARDFERAMGKAQKLIGAKRLELDDTGSLRLRGCGEIKSVDDEEGFAEEYGFKGITREWPASNDTAVAVVFCDITEGGIASDLESCGIVDYSQLRGRRESFGIYRAGNLLVVAGSERLGAIYGMYELSEQIGVSPLEYWADACVVRKRAAELKCETPYISKEPSVRYRGFFINDEWPCFGNWTMEHFGGFTAKMYEHVFDFLLRMRGNYLWPAMWSSNFAWDGPGLASFELADEYGIYMGNSHHEPCLRSGEEWTQVNAKDPSYGGAWSVLTNYDGVVRFWRESMEERGHLRSVVTVGMRGERDSTILGENATLADNINVVKTAIRAQKEILAEQEKRLNKTFPKMLALYKEVEPFYFGDEKTEGLSEWEGLDDVILMLCEDNHNYTRILSDPALSKHKGGLGMYYHVDYHGGPVSYEWINSTPLSVIWEQMTQAYEFGVKDLWILNVGDLKFNEFPLMYFMRLAYDFEKWGSSAPNKTQEYTLELLKGFFDGALDDDKLICAERILTESVRLGSLRRPEMLKPDTYSLENGEAYRILARADRLEKESADLYEEISKISEEATQAYYSLIHFHAQAMANHIKLNIYAGINNARAFQNRKSANDYGDMEDKCIERNHELNAEFAAFKDCKWRGMEREAHIGFTKWNDDGYRYPLIAKVRPVDQPRMQMVTSDTGRIYDKTYGAPMRAVINDFEYPDNTGASFVLCNVGNGSIEYEITVPGCAWLTVGDVKGSFENEKVINLKCDHSAVSGAESVVLRIKGSDGTVVEAEIRAKGLYSGREKAVLELYGKIKPSAVHFAGKYGYDIPAGGYCAFSAPEGSKPLFIEDYGRNVSALKTVPVTSNYEKGNEPFAEYALYCDKAGEYEAELHLAPVNPPARNSRLCYGFGTAVCTDDAAPDKPCDKITTEYYPSVSEEYRGGENYCPEWTKAAIMRERVMKHTVKLEEGINRLRFGFCEPGIVLERIKVYGKK